MFLADKLQKTPANKNINYWSPLSCLVEEQEDDDVEPPITEQIFSVTTEESTQKSNNKIAEKWKRKLKNRHGILDTGCTSGAGAQQDIDCFNDTGEPSSKVFMLPNKTKIRATKKMTLQHNLRGKAGEMNIIPNLHSTLISVPKMADHDYIAVFDKKEARIYDGTTTTISANGKPIIVAPRCTETGLWKMELNLDYKNLGREHPDRFTAGVDEANAIFDLPNSRQTLKYFHAAAGYPTKESFLEAVRAGNYATWPGLTTTLIAKHFPDSDETQKGHMKGQRKGVRSTKAKHTVEIKTEPGTEETTHHHIPAKKMNDIFVTSYELSDEIHTDQTGKFPVTSQRGYRYIMVGIHIDANYIFCETMKNRTEGEMITAYQKMVDRMELAGLGLKHHRLDNECSENFKKCIRRNNMTWELVPPDCHRRNMAERAIQTFKNHFVAILSGVDDRFPLSLWCHLVRPAELTVNLLRQSNVAPKMSAYAHVHGQHDYMRKPFAPLGCSVMAHVKPKNRRTWDTHGEVGFNIGTSMEHHRCFHVYIVKTRATRVSDSIFFKHQYITNPQVTPETLILKAAAELTSALKGTVSRETETAAALAKVSELFLKIAESKAARTTAREQRNANRTHPEARRAVPPPRVELPTAPPPRVNVPTVDDCRVLGGRMQIVRPPNDVQIVIPPPEMQIVNTPVRIASVTPHREKHGPPSTRPNYISQDEEDEQPRGYNTRSRTTSIMQEAMLACIDITKPHFVVSAKQMANRKFPLTWLCEMANSVLGENGELLEYRHLTANPKTRETWTHSYGNELGRLAQGMPGRVKGTDTIFFIPRQAVPKERTKDVTYGLITCLIRPEKIEEPNRTRLVAGGDRVHYPFDAGTPTADLLTVKLLINSIISTPGARFFTMDIKNFYLCTPMERYEYMRLKLSDMPDDVIAHYKLRDIATPDGYVYCEIRQGMYGLPQAGIIAQELLAKRLKEHGYSQSETTPGLWTHEWRPISFSLVVDDFGVKYVGEEHAQHLLQVVQKYYKCSFAKDGERYCGLTIKWDYEGKKVHLSMPGYVANALHRFQHPPPRIPQDQPHPHVQKNYGAKVQHAKEPDDAPPLDKAGKKFIQEVTGVFLFHARAVDATMLTPLSALASEQAAPTERTMQKCLQFLDYAASQEEAILTYRASDMKLAIHSDASYLSEPKARSRAGGHMFMAGSEEIPINNGAVLNISQIIKAVMSSAAEAELGALFINAKTAVSMRCTLEELGHPQPRTPIQTDNLTAHALLTNKILPKALKAMDMRFHWLRCRGAQDQYRFYWRPGTQNLADYWTKHHPASHHKSFRPQILTSAQDPEYTKLTTPKIQRNKSFVKHVLQTPLFATQQAAKQMTIAARGA